MVIAIYLRFVPKIVPIYYDFSAFSLISHFYPAALSTAIRSSIDILLANFPELIYFLNQEND
jgi:hypothetical protein